MASPCSVLGCEKSAVTRGWCGTHYERWRRNGDPGPAGDARRKPVRTCSVEICERPAEKRDWCEMHYQRWRKSGDPLLVERPTYGTCRRVKNGYVDLYEPTHPLARKDGYVYEHRKVAWDAGLLTDPSLHVHHRNHDKRDNRIENLEVLDAVAHQQRHVGDTVRNQFGEWPVLRGPAWIERKRELARGYARKRYQRQRETT